MSYSSNSNKRFKHEATDTLNTGPGNTSYDSSNMYHKTPAPAKPNNILLYTILNQKYVITIEAIFKISDRFGGKVLRIVMIRKKGTQAMVEFDSVETAEKAKAALHDQDIYSGCCTLKIDYSRTTKLNVRQNDMNTWDFTVQPQLTAEATKQPLISNGPPGANYYGQGQQGGTGYERYNQGGGYNQGGYNQGGYNQGGYGGYDDMQGGGGYGGYDNRTPVAIMYGLTEEVNCTHLFNILCLYGNVKRIKFMKSKQGCAMIEFADCEGVSKACKLTGYELFNSKLTIRPSKSKFVGEPKGEAFNLPDGTPGYEDFQRSKFNRFTTAEKASRNRAQDVRSTIHFFNAPKDADEDSIRNFIEEDGKFSVDNLIMFPQKEHAKSQAGLLSFANVSVAMDVIAQMNHKTMDSAESTYPYNVKLCFATQDQAM